MTSTYTTSNRLEKPETGDYINSWGEQRNEDLDMIDDALDGVLSLNLTANKTLTTVDGAADEARNRIVQVTASDGDYTVTLPTAVKWYYIINDDTSNYITFKVSGGSKTVILAPRTRQTVYCDGSEITPMAAAGQWFYLSSSSPTGTNQARITLDRTVFKEWLCEFSGCSHDDAGTPSNFSVYAGSTTSLAGSVTSTTTISGVTEYTRHNLVGTIKSLTKTTLSGTQTATASNLLSDGAFPSEFGVQWDAGDNFDAGTVTFWAR